MAVTVVATPVMTADEDSGPETASRRELETSLSRHFRVEARQVARCGGRVGADRHRPIRTETPERPAGPAGDAGRGGHYRHSEPNDRLEIAGRHSSLIGALQMNTTDRLHWTLRSGETAELRSTNQLKLQDLRHRLTLQDWTLQIG